MCAGYRLLNCMWAALSSDSEISLPWEKIIYSQKNYCHSPFTDMISLTLPCICLHKVYWINGKKGYYLFPLKYVSDKHICYSPVQ